MPEYLAPGVYIEEISVGPKPIEGVSTSTAGMLGITERGPVDPRLVTNLGEYQRLYGGYLKDSYLPNSVEGFFVNGGGRNFIARIVSEDAETAKLNQGELHVWAVGPGIWGTRVGILIENAESGVTENFKLIVVYLDKAPITWATNPATIIATAQAVEVYDELTYDVTSANFYAKIVNSQSFLIKFTKSDTDESKPDSSLIDRPANTTVFTPLTSTQIEDPEVVLSDFTGNPAAPAGKKTGIEAFKEVDEINILYCPDVHYSTLNKVALRQAIVGHCEELKDRFAILDSDSGLSNVSSVVKPLDSAYAAFYYPWIKVYDPITKDNKLVPPGGHMAGIYARSDTQRGVHKAPANETVSGAVALEFPISKEQQAILNPRGINVIREFQGRGIRVWGARTCSSDPEWKYINVRRLFIYVEESIDKGTQWVVFEPNNQQLWGRVKQSVTNFLVTVWRDGALMGTAADQAFFVDIGYSTMTQADIDNGKLICMIGIAPTKPAEFVIFRIFQKTSEAS
jgi:phage tail sheath protein FI